MKGGVRAEAPTAPASDEQEGSDPSAGSRLLSFAHRGRPCATRTARPQTVHSERRQHLRDWAWDAFAFRTEGQAQAAQTAMPG
jgi:hypothetical protein